MLRSFARCCEAVPKFLNWSSRSTCLLPSSLEDFGGDTDKLAEGSTLWFFCISNCLKPRRKICSKAAKGKPTMIGLGDSNMLCNDYILILTDAY